MDTSILYDGRTLTLSVDAEGEAATGPVPDQMRISEQALEEALGWQLKPEGLCQGDVCVPVRDRAALVHADGVDLGAFAELIGRPIVIDGEARVAALGTAAQTRAASMASLEAPDFELPDLAGSLHTLSAHRGKKVLLIAYASW